MLFFHKLMFSLSIWILTSNFVYGIKSVKLDRIANSAHGEMLKIAVPVAAASVIAVAIFGKLRLVRNPLDLIKEIFQLLIIGLSSGALAFFVSKFM